MSTEFKEDKKPLNMVQYAAKDYPTFYDSILARLRETYGDEYDDFASTSVGIMLVNLMSYGLSQLSWYLDRRSSENYLATARTRDAVTRLASQIGYKPKRASAASVELEITFDALAADVIMPQGFKFRGPGGLGYQLMTDVSLSVGQTSAVVTVSEGEQRSQTFTSNGQASQLYLLPGILDGEYLADQSVRVFVNGLEWAEQDFITYDRTDHFSVSYTTAPPRVIFGDGSAGNIPQQGSEIRIQYRVIKAETGNVRSNTITSAIDRLIVAGDFVPIKTVTNPLPASGGSGPQSLDEIKKIAPLSFQAGGSAVTQQDYYAIVNGFSDPVYGSVSKGFAAVTRSTELDTYTTARLNEIDGTAQAIWSDVDQNYEGLLAERLGAVNPANDSIEAALDDIGGQLASILATASQVKAVAKQTEDYALACAGGISTIEDVITEITTLINDPAPDIVTINTLLNNMREVAIKAKTAANNAASTAGDSITSDSASITDEATAGRVSWARAESNLEIARTGIQSMQTAFNRTWWNTQSSRDEILADTEMLRVHLNGLFDDSCKSNVVTVPILVEGREGFFQSPSNGLIRALQKHLDDVKEVTHLVRVVDGSSALVPAEIVIKVRYNASFVKAEVKAEITAGIDAVLRRRDFKQSLYLSDLYSVTELIDGIDHVNIEIINPAVRLDTDGNLIVGELEVVTKGSVTIEEV